MLKLPRAILFDLDDTIIDAYGKPERAWTAVVAEMSDGLGGLPPALVVETILASAQLFWADPEQHRIWRQQMQAARREVVAQAFLRLAMDGHDIPDADFQERLADRFSQYRNENIRLFPDAHATIDALKARGVKLALITNGASEHQREKIIRFALTERFDHIQIEGEHGFGKPEERAYRHCLATLGVEPQEAWIVGDNLEWEVIAPQRLGVYSIWYDPHGAGIPEGHAAKPDRIIRTLRELLD